MPTRQIDTSTGRFQRCVMVLGLAALFSFSAAGCGALDELDKSAAMLEKGGPPAAEQAAQGSGGANRRGLDWSDAKSVTSGELDSTIIQCSIDGSVTFTRRDDCLAQGGTPKSI